MPDSTDTSSKLMLILIGGTMVVIIIVTLFLSIGGDRDPGAQEVQTAPESLVDTPEERQNYGTETGE